ncbi:hypothetical protein BS47DRAFT_1361010 [Hydnum rufescens UP504]|uniref:Uncharacterized protein n=1 Tax=Hydnum rufescens UP504 TaxID=1448309 RepID=A0A9P6B0I5_9AGAM|nr:hypothetical protein BS47DRAFT_1361010 [Hydnum rufescens UP504]
MTIDEIAYHTPAEAGTFYCVISDPTNAQIRPGAKHGTTQPPIPRSSISGNIYEDETNTAPHTRFGGYLHCPISDSTNADQVQSKTWDRAAPIPRPSIFHNNETRNKYGATHPLRRVIIQ